VQKHAGQTSVVVSLIRQKKNPLLSGIIGINLKIQTLVVYTVLKACHHKKVWYGFGCGT